MTFPVNGPSGGSGGRLPTTASSSSADAAPAASPSPAVYTPQAPDPSVGGVITKNGLPASVLPMHAASPAGLKNSAEAITNLRQRLPAESTPAFDRFIKAKIDSLISAEQNSALAKSDLLPKLNALKATCLPSGGDSISQALSEKTGRMVPLSPHIQEATAPTPHAAMTRAGEELVPLLWQIHQANRDSKSQAASLGLNNKEGEKAPSSGGNTPSDARTETGSGRSGLAHSLETLLRTPRDLSSDPSLHVFDQSGNGGQSGSQHEHSEEEEEQEEPNKVEKAEAEFSPYDVMTDAFFRSLENATSHPPASAAVQRADASSQTQAAEGVHPTIFAPLYISGLNPYIYLEDSYSIASLLLSALLEFVTITGNSLTTLYNQYDYEAKNLGTLQKTLNYLSNHLAGLSGDPDVDIDELFPEPPIFLDTPIQCTDCRTIVTDSTGKPVGELLKYKNLGINYGVNQPSGSIVSEEVLLKYPNYDSSTPPFTPPLNNLTKPPGLGLSVFDLFIYYKVIVDTGDASTNKDFTQAQPFGIVQSLVNAGSAAIQSKQNDINILSQHTSTLLKNRASALQALSRVNNKLLNSIRFIIRNI